MIDDKDDDFDILDALDEDKDFSAQVIDNEPEHEVDNDCGDSCKL